MRRRELDFKISDLVYLKVSPMKGVKIFGKKERLSPQYVGSYRIWRCTDNVSYNLDLPTDLASLYPIFYVPLLKKYSGDVDLVVSIYSVGMNDSFSYKEVPVKILTVRFIS